MTPASNEPRERPDDAPDLEVEGWIRDAASGGAAPAPRDGFAAGPNVRVTAGQRRS